MSGKLTILITIALASSLAWAQAPQKFAIINFQEVILKTRDGQQAAADLKTKFTPKEQEFQKRGEELQRLNDELRKTENTISDEKKLALQREIDAKTKAMTRDRDDVQEDLSQEQQKIINELGGKIMQVLNKYSAEKGYTMVFDVSGQPNNILFASTAIDITHDIIALYDSSATTTPAAKPAAPAATSTPPPARRPAATTPAAPSTQPAK